MAQFEENLEVKSLNCQTCGKEHETRDLQTVKISGFKEKFLICVACKNMAPIELLRDATDLMNDISKISKAKDKPEIRLQKILDLLK